MENIFVWKARVPELRFADDEISSLEALRSDSFLVTVADGSLEWAGLANAVGAIRPTVFHFIGHGDCIGNLTVPEGPVSVGRPARDVVEVVRAAAPDLKGVYLSGCHTSRPGPDLLQALAPAGGWVVGTRAAVDDDLAQHFAADFYKHLISFAGSPTKAFNIAHAYARADWGEEVVHELWGGLSNLPTVDEITLTIQAALRDVFNRPAFQISMTKEVSIVDLEDALQDVGHALGTGEVRSRHHRSIIQAISFPVLWLHEPEIKHFITSANRGIAATRRAVAIVKAQTDGDYIVGTAFNVKGGANRAAVMRQINEVDHKRNQIIRAANRLFAAHHLTLLPEIQDSFTTTQIKDQERTT